MIDIPETEEIKHVPVIQQLILLGVIMLLVFGTGYIPKILSPKEKAPSLYEINVLDTETHEIAKAAALPTIDSFADVIITGQSAFVWDINKQKVLYEKNPDEQLPLASITKLMTALVAHELVRQDAPVPVTLSAIKQDGSSGFRDGETFSLANLTDLTLISSSNDGAYAIASAAGAVLAQDGNVNTFVQAMNIRAEELGLSQTYFRNPTGLDISETEAGAYGSARDIAFLVEHILKHEPNILEATTETSTRLYNTTGDYHTANNTNVAISEIAGLIGSKTGYTELAGGNLTIAFDAAPNRPVVVVVLGSTVSERFTDVVNLSAAARLAIE